VVLTEADHPFKIISNVKSNRDKQIFFSLYCFLEAYAGGMPVVFAILMLIAGSPLSAQSINFTTMSSTSGVPGDNMPAGGFIINSASSAAEWVGIINITVQNYEGVQLPQPYPTVPVFCIQLSVNINGGQNYTFQVGSLSQGDGGTLTATAVRDLTTLYYLYYQGNTDSNWTNQKAAAFQLDAWKITLNPGNYNISGSSTGGTFYNNGWNPTDGAVTLAQTWLTAISGTTASSGGITQPVALISSSVQNLIYPQEINQSFVPFEVNAWPGAAFLCTVGFIRTQRRLKAAA